MKRSIFPVGLVIWLLAATGHAESRGPSLPGQDTFGAVAEIVTILGEDPGTDWEKVDIHALREHLVDMSRLFLDAQVAEREVEGGLEMTVTGAGRTLEAIQRMIPAHSGMLQASAEGVRSEVQLIEEGARWTVRVQSAPQRARLQGLGFFGLMSLGQHHQSHHIAIARGEHPHARRH